MLECLYTSTKQVTSYSSLTYGNFTFLRAWDACLMMIGYNLYKVFRDGTTIFMGGCTSNVAYVSTSGGLITYWNYFDGRPIKCCQFLAQPIYTSPYSSYIFSIGQMWGGAYIDVELGLVFSKYQNGRYADVYNLADGAFIRRITVGPSAANYSFSYAGYGRFCAISTSGIVVIYDYISWEIVQQSVMGVTNRAATYDCTHNIILTVDATGHVNVWSLDDAGDGLAAPTFSPTGNKYLYSGYRLTTRLLGSGSTPIVGKWINWELIGIKGTLEKPYSITDDNGYAYNFYYCPTDDTQLGSETVRVWCDT